MATITDRITAAFKKHGPMTTRDLGKHVDDKSVSAICGTQAKRGIFAVLGGKKFSLIYGLPDQEAPAAGGGDAPPRHLHPRGKKKAIKKAKRSAVARVKPARAPKTPRSARQAADAVAGRFGLFSDGSLSVEVSDGAINLTPNEARALGEYLDRTLIRPAGD